jgi:hypothetical protein
MIGLIRFLLAILASPFKSRWWLEDENAALRQQLFVLRRKLNGSARLTNTDGRFLVFLYRWSPSLLDVITVIRPQTLVRSQQGGSRFYRSPPDRDWQQVYALSNKLSLSLYPADPRIEIPKTGSPLWGARNRRKLSSEPGR